MAEDILSAATSANDSLYSGSKKYKSKEVFQDKWYKKSEKDHRQRKSNNIYNFAEKFYYLLSICCQKPLHVLVQKRSAVFEVKVFEVKVQQIVA